jgi:glycerol kinase
MSKIKEDKKKRMKVVNGKYGKIVGEIDEGKRSERFLIFEENKRKVVEYKKIEIRSNYNKEGWVEKDKKEILIDVKK